MASASCIQRRGRTILPTDVFVFTFLALGVSAGSNAATNNPISVVVFTLVWMTAAITRLVEFRRGDKPAVQLSSLDLRAAVILVVGSGPWLMLGFLQSAYPSSAMWKPIDLPPFLRAVGLALAIAVIAEPFLHLLRRWPLAASSPCSTDSPGGSYRFSSSMAIRSGAILLLSGSPIFALLCALWLGVTFWPSADQVRNSLRLPLAEGDRSQQRAGAGNQLAIPLAETPA